MQQLQNKYIQIDEWEQTSQINRERNGGRSPIHTPWELAPLTIPWPTSENDAHCWAQSVTHCLFKTGSEALPSEKFLSELRGHIHTALAVSGHFTLALQSFPAGMETKKEPLSRFWVFADYFLLPEESSRAKCQDAVKTVRLLRSQSPCIPPDCSRGQPSQEVRGLPSSASAFASPLCRPSPAQPSFLAQPQGRSACSSLLFPTELTKLGTQVGPARG